MFCSGSPVEIEYQHETSSKVAYWIDVSLLAELTTYYIEGRYPN
ncbi:MAG TPA: hypothetical protein PK644_00310 [bacterium]|nr:hypothetical protein [bacterium]